MASIFCVTPASAGADLTTAEKIAKTGEFVFFSVEEAIVSGYRAAPALMLGLAMLLVVPLLAISTRMVLWLRRQPEKSRRGHKSGPVDGEEGVVMAAPQREEAYPLSGHAFLEIVGAANARFALLRDMLRIGREDDNDIRIASDRVHRYHAAILREDIGCYRITDLSGHGGTGVIVNGEPCSGARLRDGDVIDLGPGRLKFHAGLV